MSGKNRRSTFRGKSRNLATGKTERSFAGRALRIGLSLLGTVILVIVFSPLGSLHKVWNFILDVEIFLREPPATTDVAIVRITDKDYEQFLEGKWPLTPFKLQVLINAISKGKPKMIAVDMDTSAPQFREVQIEKSWPPIIWSREPKKIPDSVLEKIKPLDVLGGKDPALNADSGIPFLIEDAEDKVTRRYRRLVETIDGTMPTFSWAVIQRATANKPQRLEPSQEDFYIRFYKSQRGEHNYNLTASTVLELAAEGGSPDNHPLKDKIVLLGGTYLGQDLHDTPVGRLPGVEILGQVIETELQGGGEKVPTRLTIFVLIIFEGIGANVLFYLFNRHRHIFRRHSLFKALMLTLLALFGIAALCSYLAFGLVGRWMYFAPLLILLLLLGLVVEYRTDSLEELLNSLLGSSPNPNTH